LLAELSQSSSIPNQTETIFSTTSSSSPSTPSTSLDIEDLFDFQDIGSTQTQEFVIDLDEQQLTSAVPSPPSNQDQISSIGHPIKKFQILESEVDSIFGINLPIKVSKSSSIYISSRSSHWAILSRIDGPRAFICRFCGIDLDRQESALDAYSHIIGERYYRKNRKIQRKTQRGSLFDSVSRCPFATPAMESRARSEILQKIQPKSEEGRFQLVLDSTAAKNPQQVQSTSSKLDFRSFLKKLCSMRACY